MPLTFQPRPRSVVMCDFAGFVVPEMVKVRPVVVLARHRQNRQLVTIVPLSTTQPLTMEAHHHELSVNPLPDKAHIVCWAKCDMLATVSLHRLDRYKIGKRQYVVPEVSEQDFAAIRAGVARALGLADNLAVPERDLRDCRKAASPVGDDKLPGAVNQGRPRAPFVFPSLDFSSPLELVMPGPARAGALIYAKDLPRLSHFYQQLLAMQLLLADDEHHVLQSADFQLIVHAIPPHIAATITLAEPPAPRENTAMKLFFSVLSMANAADAMARLGGSLFEPVWSGPGFAVRNGCDPEGNVFQLREWRAEA